MQVKLPNADNETVATIGPVAIAVRGNAARFCLRGAVRHGQVLSEAFGVRLPLQIGACVRVGNREALCLGPDEWALHAPEGDGVVIADAFQAIYAAAPHSLTDISDRDVTIEICGADAEALLAVGCPVDIGAIPAGDGKRTVFNGVQIVLYKDSQNDFRIDVWRSFLPQVLGVLYRANDELFAGL